MKILLVAVCGLIALASSAPTSIGKRFEINVFKIESDSIEIQLQLVAGADSYDISVTPNFDTYRKPSATMVSFSDFTKNDTIATVNISISLSPSQSYEVSVYAVKNDSLMEENSRVSFTSNGCFDGLLCKQKEFEDPSCLPKSKMCDGKVDCLHRDDEQSCNQTDDSVAPRVLSHCLQEQFEAEKWFKSHDHLELSPRYPRCQPDGSYYPMQCFIRPKGMECECTDAAGVTLSVILDYDPKYHNQFQDYCLMLRGQPPVYTYDYNDI